MDRIPVLLWQNVIIYCSSLYSQKYDQETDSIRHVKWNGETFSVVLVHHEISSVEFTKESAERIIKILIQQNKERNQNNDR